MEIGEEMKRKVQERWREYGFVYRGAVCKVACPLFFPRQQLSLYQLLG